MAESPTPYKVALVVWEATVGSYDQSCKDKMKSLVRILNIEVKVKSPCEISSCETMLWLKTFVIILEKSTFPNFETFHVFNIQVIACLVMGATHAHTVQNTFILSFFSLPNPFFVLILFFPFKTFPHAAIPGAAEQAICGPCSSSRLDACRSNCWLCRWSFWWSICFTSNLQRIVLYFV